MGGVTLPRIFELVSPDAPGLPVLYSLPHSGRDYPDDFGAGQPMGILRRAEDAYVDRLLQPAPGQGIRVLKALFPRAYLDVNRKRDDLDPELLPPGTIPAPGPKSALGIGLIRRLVTPEHPIYERILSMAEIEARVQACYIPYHQVLSRTLGELRNRFDQVLFIDWHSMKSTGNAATPDGAGGRRADFVIGDLHGKSCAAGLTHALISYLEAAGFETALNDPYAGGATLEAYADPAAGVHGLQIEINRALYLEEASVRLKPEARHIADVLTGIGARLPDWIAGALS